MALAIDGTTPALATASTGNVATTASFTPPAGSVLCAVAWHDTAGGNTTNTSIITDTLTGSWAIQATRNRADAGGQNGHVQVSTSVASGAALQVSTTASSTGGSLAAGLYVLAMTGCDTTTPVDVVAEGSNAAGVISLAFSTVTDLAWAFLVNVDWNVTATPTPSAGETQIIGQGLGVGPDLRIWLVRQTNTTTPAGSVTMSSTAPTTGNTNNFIGWAFRPAAVVAASSTPEPLVVVAPTPRRAGVASVLRGSLADDPVLTTPQPIISTVPGRRGIPNQVLRRGSLADDPVLTTPDPIVVSAAVRARPGVVLQLRSSLADDVAPTAATPQPLVIVSAAKPRTGFASLSRGSLTDPPTPQPLVVALPRARPGSAVLLLRGALADDPIFTTAGPIVVAAARPRQPGISMLSRAPLEAVDCDCITHRPFAGTTARPGSGVTARPDTGLTARPCTC